MTILYYLRKLLVLILKINIDQINQIWVQALCDAIFYKLE